MIRRILDYFLRRESPEGDIFIFTMPRSGMTWLMEMFDTLGYTRCIQEPMTSAWIPQMSRYFRARRRYIDLKPDEFDAITRYLTDIQKNKVHRMGYNFFRGRKRAIKLNVIALARVSNLAPALEKALMIRPIVFLRHPVANSLSKMRNLWHVRPRFGESGWSQFIDVYLESSSFCGDYLDSMLVERCWKIRREGSDLERHVVSWCLDATVVLNELKVKSWLLVCYEDLVVRPEWVVAQLSEHFQLTGANVMLSRIGVPSASSHLSDDTVVEAISNPETRYQLISRWRSEIEPGMAERCFGILEAFGIDLYDQDGDEPTRSTESLRIAGRKDLIRSRVRV